MLYLVELYWENDLEYDLFENGNLFIGIVDSIEVAKEYIKKVLKEDQEYCDQLTKKALEREHPDIKRSFNVLDYKEIEDNDGINISWTVENKWEPIFKEFTIKEIKVNEFDDIPSLIR